MKNLPPLKILLVAFGGWAISSCAAPGPAVTVCIVDPAENGFDCLTYPKTRFFKPWSEGEGLECLSPDGLEIALKQCKAHQMPELTICTLELLESKFLCKPPHSDSFTIDIPIASNYACMNETDKRRMLERCH